MVKENMLYVGYYVNDVLFNTIVEKNINNMSAASHRLEEALLKEFANSPRINVSALSYLPSSPSLGVTPCASLVGGLEVRHIPIRKGSLGSCILGAWRFWRFLNKEVPRGANVIMYAVNPVFMVPLLFGKRLRRLRLTTICSEVPAFRRYKASIPMKIKKAVQTFFNNRFDNYIFLAEPMKEVVKVGKKPYMVMEGIASSLPEELSYAKRRNIVMYAGGLHPDNNVMLLIDACQQSLLVDECWICGSGPQENEIRQRVAHSSKIKMLGRLTTAEVLDLEKQVKVLVNLRDNTNPLTRFSFPSKVIEYLASGAHVISPRLDGIPSEYYEHLYLLSDYTVDSLITIIEDIMGLSEEAYFQRSSDALKFLCENKTASIQAKKVIDFICQH